MAQSPSSRPESFEPHKSRSAPTAWEGSGRGEPETVSRLARWQSLLSAHGGGPVSADLALDLVLNEIAEVTRESTRAHAAAIALARDGEMVCRATTGDGAPGLGARLSGDTGLSASCVQTGNWQCCEDSEEDARVDALLCRQLGVRSILAVPVLKAGELLGVLEIFSGQAGAFGEREVRTLQMLSRSIVENIELAKRASAKREAVLPGEAVAGNGDGKQPAGAANVHASAVEQGPETADFWTGALMVAVVALAVTLGWMVGRGGRQGSKANALRQGNAGLQSKAKAGAADLPAGTAVSPTTAAETSGSGPETELVVYENGRMVFPKTPAGTDAKARDSMTAAEVKPAVETSKVQAAGPVRIPPEVAAGYITSRVEPEYPEGARARRVQGAVVLDTLIGGDGRVRKFTAIRGDPELAAAASTAVRQWQFKAFVRNGQSEDFQTSITVVFRLP
ncbi:MAG: TonB family protein [Terriglobales bacterium]